MIPKKYPFLRKVWDGYSNRQRVIMAVSYTAAAEPCHMYPPGYIWSVEPITEGTQ